MSQYDILDDKIINKLASEGPMPLLFLNAQEVRRECDRLEVETGREAFRILDGRLQRLRKQGRIVFNSKNGWGCGA